MHHLSAEEIAFFRTNGVVCLKQSLHSDWIKLLTSGFEKNLASPSRFAGFYSVNEANGRFQDDYCNWQNISEFRRVVFDSDLASMAALLLDAKIIRFFFEHIFFKKGGTVKKTPWHQDLPYFCIDGDQGVTFWIPLTPIDDSNKIEFIAGSHLWEKLFLPQKFNGIDTYDVPKELYDELPNLDDIHQSYQKLSWTMDLGDILAFDFRCVHGNTESPSKNLADRRSIALRFIGENMRFTSRPGEKSPPFTEVKLNPGDELDHSYFPIIFRQK